MATEAPSKKQVIGVTYLVVFVMQGCMFMYLSLMPYVYNAHGVDTIVFGYIQSAYAALQVVTALGIGWFGDTYGTRAVLLLNTLSSCVAHVISGLAGNVYMLVFARASSLFQDSLPGAQMIVADVVDETSRSDILGKMMLPMSLGMILGPIISGMTAKYIGEQNTHLMIAVLPALMAVVIMTTLPQTTKTVAKDSKASEKKGGLSWQSVKRLIFQGDVPFLLFMKLCTTLPGMTLFMNFGLIGMKIFKLPPEQNSLFGASMGITAMVANGFVVGRLAKKFTPDVLLKWAAVSLAVIYLLMTMCSPLWQVLVCMSLMGIPYAVLENQITSRLTSAVPSSETGSMVGINMTVFHLARTIAPLVGGYMIKNYSFAAFGYFGCLVTCLSVISVFIRTQVKHDKKE